MDRKEIHIISPRSDSFGLRSTNSDVTDVIQFENLTQIYKGPIVKGCYHGKGIIIWIEKSKKKMYEGYFYTNQIHGYGRMTYGNGLIFEGLYKHNIRFGPGVVTHPDHHQEVGFWVGTHILRLCCNLTTHTVPTFSVTNVYTEIKLLQFRHLIDITQPPHSIINIRDNNEKYLNDKYSFPYFRHLNSLFFDTQAFDYEFILNSMTSMDNKEINSENQFMKGCDLEQLITKNYLKISKVTSRTNKEFLLNCGFGIGKRFELLSSKSWTIKNQQYKNAELKNVEHADSILQLSHSKILAYNNNTLDKMILAHAYQQSFGEATLLYNLNNIWKTNRSIFMPSLSQETWAVHLLSKLDLSPENIKNLIAHYNVDSDVADSRGNTRLMISSVLANDQHEIIKCMINLGANLECYNDDGFTPLNLTLMRYICLLNDIKHWNEFLIPHVNLQFNIKKGDQNVTLNNIQEINFFRPENFSNLKFTEKYAEIEDTKSTLKHLPKTKKLTLVSVQDTIELLINMGAKATTCFVPKPSIHLALMTINPTILKAMFKAGGSPSYTFSNENCKLNLLHMAVMMPTNYSIIKCVEVLMLHHVDPNSKALPMFSVFRHKYPWITITNDNTMTPLDIFCLKENSYKLHDALAVDEQSENELASILYDVTERSNAYCGFMPIALAMLTGKLNLTEVFLNKDRTVVNETISGVGTLLTLLVNPIYNLNLSNQTINKLLDLLLKSNSNPLKIVMISDREFRGNIYEYCIMLTESKKKRIYQKENLPNYTEIVEKLENAGRTILNIIYAERAKDVLKTSPFSDIKMAMLLWFDSDLRIKMHQVKVEKISNYQPYTYRTAGIKNQSSDKDKVKLQRIKRNSKILNQMYLTQEEILVCYECLKHSSKKMEACSSCYFALLCSENCKRRHGKQRCIIQIRQRRLEKLQDILNKSDVTMKNLLEKKSYSHYAHLNSSEKSARHFNSYKHTSLSSISMRPSSLSLRPSSKTFRPPSITLRSSSLSLLQPTKMLPISVTIKSNLSVSSRKFIPMRSYSLSLLQSSKMLPLSLSMMSRLSVFSRKLNSSFTDLTRSDLEQSQKNLTRARKYEESNKLDDWSNNYSNSAQIHHSESIHHNTNTSRNEKYGLNVYSQGLYYYKDDSNLDKGKPFKNDQIDELDKSTIFMTKWRDNYKTNYWKSIQKTQNVERNLIRNSHLSSIFISLEKYMMVRSPGCRRPIFMFIRRGSNEDETTLGDLITTGIAYFMFSKNNQRLCNKISDNQLGVLNNYSLI